MTFTARLQILRVMAARIAPVYLFRFYDLFVGFRRNFVGYMAFNTFGYVRLFGVGNVLVRRSDLSARRLKFGCRGGDIVKRSVARQTQGFLHLFDLGVVRRDCAYKRKRAQQKSNNNRDQQFLCHTLPQKSKIQPMLSSPHRRIE
jgi:hypothetical protein